MKLLINLFAFLIILNNVTAQSVRDENAIQDLVREMTEQWNNHNGGKFTAAFTEKHDFIVWNGYYRKDLSLKESAEDRQKVFNTTFRNTHQFATIDKIEFLKEDVALIHVLAALAPKNAKRPQDPELLWTGILQKINGNWKIKCFQLLDLEIFKDASIRSKIPVTPETMYASWYAEK